jgi:hypothetical protein
MRELVEGIRLFDRNFAYLKPTSDPTEHLWERGYSLKPKLEFPKNKFLQEILVKERIPIIKLIPIIILFFSLLSSITFLYSVSFLGLIK